MKYPRKSNINKNDLTFSLKGCRDDDRGVGHRPQQRDVHDRRCLVLVIFDGQPDGLGPHRGRDVRQEQQEVTEKSGPRLVCTHNR